MKIIWHDSDDEFPILRPGYIRVVFKTMNGREGSAYVGAERSERVGGYVGLGVLVKDIEEHIGTALRSARQL